jgi:transmembrane sensor
MRPSEEQIRAAVAQQAAAWFVANQAGPLDPADRVAFVAWLKASPIHVKEYLGVALVAHDLPAATADPDVPLEDLLAEARADETDSVVSFGQSTATDEPPTKRFWVSRSLPLAASAAAVVVAVVASLLWWARDGELLGLPRTYETTHGEQRALRLPDGSMLHLNTDSAATVRYSRRERVVDVERGQALFEAAPDGSRRFRVTAGDAQVLVVGTQFEVYRRPNKTAVITVIEGSVGVWMGEPTPRKQDAILPADALRVGAGQQLRIEAGIMPGHAVPVNLQQAMAWLQRKIAFEQRPLGEVAEEFNRYSQIMFEIDDPALRALPISGVFGADDTDSFAAFLETLEGVDVQRTGARIRVGLSLTKGEPPPAR